MGSLENINAKVEYTYLHKVARDVTISCVPPILSGINVGSSYLTDDLLSSNSVWASLSLLLSFSLCCSKF